MPVTATNPESLPLDRETPSGEQEKAGTRIWRQGVIYAIAILLSSFLLFQVELMMGKSLLPRFGGGPSVWSTSLLVFQFLLLAGYGYAAFICTKFSPRVQGTIHVCLLASAGLAIGLHALLLRSPILPSGYRATTSVENPVWQITWLLVTAVGIQSVLLSATSPLLQNWFTRNYRSSPYRLYALSNLGSMLGLLTYPLLVERNLKLSTQVWVWTAGYAAFSLVAAACALFYIPPRPEPTKVQTRKRSEQKKRKKSSEPESSFLWLVLPACSCTMLLATTNLICQQIAPVPLLWVLPLSLYLLTFIVCFDHPRWYRRSAFGPLYVVVALLALQILPRYSSVTVSWLVFILCSALMIVCMVCHGELTRLKPDPQHLTSFYLMVSAGGALGSAAVVLLAPQIFNRYWEFQIALLGCGLLLAVALVRDKDSFVYSQRHGGAILAALVGAMVASAGYFTNELLDWEGATDSRVVHSRNFFGVKTVLHEEGRTALAHGHTLHGMQYSDPAGQNVPTLYYARQSGIGMLLDHFPRTVERAGLRVGVVGMGVGTLAAYGHAGDYFRFYEIDPAIPSLSLGDHPEFTFLRSSPARIDIVIGDARIKMQDEVSRGEPQNFDVLVVDAFSGDTIPVHLLTQEAMDLYLRQLHGPESVVAFHLSSSVLDLRSVVQDLADLYHLASIEIDTQPPGFPATWILLSRDPGMFQKTALVTQAHPVEISHAMQTWTDDYSNLYQLLNW